AEADILLCPSEKSEPLVRLRIPPREAIENLGTDQRSQVTCPVSSDHAQLETTTPAVAVDCPSRDDGPTGRGAEAPHTAALRPVARAGAASSEFIGLARRAANSAGVR